jgi:amidohydrolase
MSIALGTAIVLSNLKDKIKGNIKFIFQPAEEGPPKGEEGGAALMEKEGVLKEPPVMAIFGQHVWPSIDVGQILFSSGPIMASSDTVEIIIKGKSSHGARPYEGIDAITLAAHTIVSIQSFMDRMIDPSDPAVVSIGKIRGGGRSNIIADSVTLEGTVRTLTRTNRIKIETMLENIVQGITYPFGANYTFNYQKGAPPVYNHPGLADIMLPVLQEAVGKDNVLPLQPQMVAEDFSIFSQKIPGFYFFLGVKPPGQKTMPPLHSPFFNPDERSIVLGIKIACYLLLDCLAYQDSFGSNFN